MSSTTRVGLLTALTLAVGIAFAQTTARLRTSDTEVVLEAGPGAPQ